MYGLAKNRELQLGSHQIWEPLYWSTSDYGMFSCKLTSVLGSCSTNKQSEFKFLIAFKRVTIYSKELHFSAVVCDVKIGVLNPHSCV